MSSSSSGRFVGLPIGGRFPSIGARVPRTRPRTTSTLEDPPEAPWRKKSKKPDQEEEPEHDQKPTPHASAASPAASGQSGAGVSPPPHPPGLIHRLLQEDSRRRVLYRKLVKCPACTCPLAIATEAGRIFVCWAWKSNEFCIGPHKSLPLIHHRSLS